MRKTKNITTGFLALLMGFMSIAPNAMAARFYVNDADLRKGCAGTVEIMLDTEGANILAADATMNYTPTETNLNAMNIGLVLPMQTYNVIAGTVLELSGARLPGTGSFLGNGVYGAFNIIPDLAADSVTIGFSTDLSKDNVIAEEGTFANIITSATGKTIPVKDRFNVEVDGVGFCSPDVNPPTVTFIVPPNGAGGIPVDTNSLFSLQDDRSGVDISTLQYTIDAVPYTETSGQASVTDSGGVYRVETDPDTDFNQGQTVNVSVYICDSNTDPAPNCTTISGKFYIWSPAPPAPVCGDGIVTYQVGEQCDDGNLVNEDGCSALCLIETEPFECPAIPEQQECYSPGVVYQDPALPTSIPLKPAPEVTGVDAIITEAQIIAGEFPAVRDAIKDEIPGCTRTSIMEDIIKEFDVINRFNIKDEKCLADVEHCLLPYLIHSAYKDAAPEDDRYYPDVYLSGERSEPLLTDDSSAVSASTKDAIHFGTRQGMVQGYYLDTDNLSPFRPQWNMSRIQIIKLLNWAVFGQQWKYEVEYFAEIGGEQNLSLVQSSAADLDEWWHPRYLNLACNKGVLSCDPLANFGPNEICSVTWKREVLARYKVFFEGQKNEVLDTKKDSDLDGIVDMDEEQIFATNPQKADTDDDGVNDYDEIFVYLSNPKMVDSDHDYLNDGVEVNTHKTDPIKIDTDDDLYSDQVEIEAGTDPLNPLSHPMDENGNGIDDAWELLYGISPTHGSEDTDGEGLSDLLEFKYKTDPTNPDTDGDGLSDADEVLLFGSNPLEFTKLSDLGVRITNIIDHMILTDPRPLITGFAPTEGMKIEVILRNEFGLEVVLGTTTTDVNSAWIFTPEFDLLDGDFFLLVKGLDPANKRVLESPLIGVTLDSTLQVGNPIPERISDVTITDEILLEDIRIDIRDSHPIIIGRTGFKNKVVATWQSVIGTSAIVADLAGGEFRIQAAAEMPFGEHTVSIYAIRETDKAMSKVVTVKFNIKEPLSGLFRGAALGEELMFPLWVWAIIFLGASGLLSYGVHLDRKRKRDLIKKAIKAKKK